MYHMPSGDGRAFANAFIGLSINPHIAGWVSFPRDFINSNDPTQKSMYVYMSGS